MKVVVVGLLAMKCILDEFLILSFSQVCFEMEYEVYLGCNIAGAIVVVLILIYHVIAARPLKSLENDSASSNIGLNLKKSL